MLGAVGAFVLQQFNPKTDIGALKSDLVSQIEAAERRGKENIDRLQKEIDDVAGGLVTTRLTIAEYAEFKVRKDADTRREDETLSMLARIKINKEDELKDINNLNERLISLRGEVGDIRTNITGSANVGKVLDHIQQEIDDMRKLAISAPAITVSPRP